MKLRWILYETNKDNLYLYTKENLRLLNLFIIFERGIFTEVTVFFGNPICISCCSLLYLIKYNLNYFI